MPFTGNGKKVGAFHPAPVISPVLGSVPGARLKIYYALTPKNGDKTYFITSSISRSCVWHSAVIRESTNSSSR